MQALRVWGHCHCFRFEVLQSKNFKGRAIRQGIVSLFVLEMLVFRV